MELFGFVYKLSTSAKRISGPFFLLKVHQIQGLNVTSVKFLRHVVI